MITQSLCEIKVDMRSYRLALNTAGWEWKLDLFDTLLKKNEPLKHTHEHLRFGVYLALMTVEIKAENFAAICSKFSSHPRFSTAFPFIFFLAWRVWWSEKAVYLKSLHCKVFCCCFICYFVSKNKTQIFSVVFGNALKLGSHLCTSLHRSARCYCPNIRSHK